MAHYDDSRWPLVVGLAGAGLVVAGVLFLLRMLDDQEEPLRVASRPEAVEPPPPENYPFPFPEEGSGGDEGPGAGEGDGPADEGEERATDPGAADERLGTGGGDEGMAAPDAPPPSAGFDDTALASPEERSGTGTAPADPAVAGAASEDAMAGSEPEPEAVVESDGDPATAAEEGEEPEPAPSGATDPEPEPVETAFEPPYELRIRATARQVWVWVSTDGGPRQAVSLDRGETATFEARERYELTVDDAGGIETTLNGETLDRFGPNGQARRDIVLPPVS